jgi:hypothetical protein
MFDSYCQLNQNCLLIRTRLPDSALTDLLRFALDGAHYALCVTACTPHGTVLIDVCYERPLS